MHGISVGFWLVMFAVLYFLAWESGAVPLSSRADGNTTGYVRCKDGYDNTGKLCPYDNSRGPCPPGCELSPTPTPPSPRPPGHPGKVEQLTSVASDWMDQMTVNPNYGSINGTYYSGPVKQYLMTLPDSEPVRSSRTLVWT